MTAASPSPLPPPDRVTLTPTPPALVEDGRFHLGSFTAPFRSVNPLDAELRGPFPLPRAIKQLMLKEWQHWALVSPRFFLSVVLFDAKRLGQAHVVLYDRETRSTVKFEKKVAPWELAIPSDLWRGRAEFARRSLAISFDNQLERGRHAIEFRCAKDDPDRPTAIGSFVCHEPLDRIEPLVVCLPLDRGRAMYSHKGVFPLEGTLTVAGQEYPFDPATSFAIADIHKGYYPYVMKWNWATGAGYDPSGRLIGFNLTRNQVRNQHRYNENCLWIDGKRNLLPPVSFEFEDGGRWAIRDRYQRVDVVFTPEVDRRVDLDLWVMRSRYRGPFGSFSGHLVDDRGDRVAVEPCFGMGEDFYLRA